MAKRPKLSEAELVIAYFEALEHPLKEVVQLLRTIVLSTDKEIAEQIKWNSPSFYYSGKMQPFDPKEYKRDIVVFNLHKNDSVLLVFPTGSKINDSSALLEGKFADTRKIAKFTTIEEVKKKENALKTVIKAWLNQID